MTESKGPPKGNGDWNEYPGMESKDSAHRKSYADEQHVETLTSEFSALRDRAEATMTLASAWAENFTSLVQLEFQRTLQAGTRIVVMLLFLFFLAVSVIVSLCAGLGLLGYYLFESVYIGFGVFLLSQFLVIGGLMLAMKRLKNYLGFSESQRQAKEALDNVTALFKQTD